MSGTAAAAGGASSAVAGLLAVVTIFVLIKSKPKAYRASLKLDCKSYPVADVLEAVVPPVSGLGFEPLDIRSGDLFVLLQPAAGDPARPPGPGLTGGDVDIDRSKCILLDLGDVVPAGAGAAAAGGGGGEGDAAAAGVLKRLRFVEDELQDLKKAKKLTPKAFSEVGSREATDVLLTNGYLMGPTLDLPAGVAEDAATIVLEPDLPYAWREGEAEVAAMKHFLRILSAQIGRTVVDCRNVQLPPVETDENAYTGFSDGAVLPKGYRTDEAVLQVASAFLEFKTKTAFASTPKHLPQALLELLATKRPIFATDMATGFKVWVMEGQIWQPFHGDTPLTLQQGIALLRHFARLGDAAATARLAAAAAGRRGGGGGGGLEPGDSTEPPGGGEGAGAGQPPGGQLGSSSAGAGVPLGLGIGKAVGRGRMASADTVSGDEEGPPADYEEYKLRVLEAAQHLRLQGLAVPDSLLARLG